MAIYGGWTGKTLRVNLTTGKISYEDTIAKYKDYVGAEGLAFKVLWDEVPAGVHPFDPENKIIFGAGPLNGTGIPHAGRLSVTTLLATCPYHGVGTGHAGGHWSSMLKFAGWDSLIVEGKSEKPVWICIDNQNVSIRDASHLWGHGVYYTNSAIMDEMGNDASVLAIGQAGENLYGAATMMIDRFGSAQNGAPMGAKKLKAIGVRGTGSVRVACSGRELLDMINYHTFLIGDWDGSMTPNKPQPWAEYYGGSWTNGKDVFWGGNGERIYTGECDPKDVHTYAYRGPGNRSEWNKNERQMEWMVGGRACFGCASPCRQALHIPEMDAKWGTGSRPVNECGGISTTRDYYAKRPSAEAMFLGSVLADDYGIGDDYHILTGDFVYYYKTGLMKERLPKKEWDSIPWDAMEKGSPEFIRDLLRRLAFREGELGYAMGLGSYAWAKRWGAPPLEQQWQERPYGKAVAWNETSWFAPHHFEGQQVGVILNCMYNRDPCMHEQTHFNSIADGVDQKVFEAVTGVESGDAIDRNGVVTPINEAKIRLAVRLSADGVLHNSLVTCNRGGASFFSPHKERGYKGDSALDAKEYSLVTGDHKSEEEFVQTGLRIFTLMRALTMRSLGTSNMRAGHDRYPTSAYDHKDWKGIPAFTPGTERMDKEDLDKAIAMYYDAMGWDEKGCPKKETWKKLGLEDVAKQLEKAGIL